MDSGEEYIATWREMIIIKEYKEAQRADAEEIRKIGNTLERYQIRVDQVKSWKSKNYKRGRNILKECKNKEYKMIKRVIEEIRENEKIQTNNEEQNIVEKVKEKRIRQMNQRI